MIDNYKNLQPVFYSFVNKIVNNNKISHAYFIETNNVSYAFDLVMSMIKYFLTNKMNIEEAKDICDNIDAGNYPDFKIIDATSTIKKEQIIELQKNFSTKPLYGKYMIYLIRDASKLNLSSTNTLLKFLEEPADGIIAIFMAENAFSIVDTIISRCQVISLVPSLNDEYLNLKKKFSSDDEFNEYMLSVFNFYEDIEYKGLSIFTENYIYNFKDNIDLLLKIGLFIYYNILNSNSDSLLFSSYINNFNKIKIKLNKDDIIKKINIINKFIANFNINVNKDLFIDSFIICLVGGVCDD